MQNKSFKTAPNAFESEAFFVLLILFILAPFALANKEQSSKLADFEGHTYEKIDTPMTWHLDHWLFTCSSGICRHWNNLRCARLVEFELNHEGSSIAAFDQSVIT